MNSFSLPWQDEAATWVSFGLETQVRNYKPCLKQKLEGKLSKVQAGVRHSPRTPLFEVASMRDQPQTQPAVRCRKYHCVAPTLPAGWKSDTPHLPKKQI